ncbi:MAG: IS110 family transposase [bacterium]|nr:IS110 family transposase [bacterium]
MIPFPVKKPLTKQENTHEQVYRIGRPRVKLHCCRLGPSGRKLQCQVLETNTKALINFLVTIPKNRRLIFEEGTHSNWLYEVLAPHVQETVVVAVRQRRGLKDDERDACGLAEDLRIGNFKVKVYKKQGEFSTLSHLARAHSTLVFDTVRCHNRIKSLFRSRGITTVGKQVYSVNGRSQWLPQLPAQAYGQANFLYEQYDVLNEIRKQAEKQMLVEARMHHVYKVIKTCPGMGKIRTAQIMPIVVTPYRFANKHQFWAYCGLGVAMRSSSDWVRAQNGAWIKVQTQKTRGLNRNFNHIP